MFAVTAINVPCPLHVVFVFFLPSIVNQISHRGTIKTWTELMLLLHCGSSLTPRSSCRGLRSARCREPCCPAAGGGCNLRSVWPECPVTNQETALTSTVAVRQIKEFRDVASLYPYISSTLQCHFHRCVSLFYILFPVFSLFKENYIITSWCFLSLTIPSMFTSNQPTNQHPSIHSGVNLPVSRSNSQSLPDLFVLRLQRRLQDVSELSQLFPLSVLSLFNLNTTEEEMQS